MLLTNLKVVGVVVVTLGVYTWVANAIPQVRSEVPAELSFTGTVSEVELVAAGEELYSGAGQCTSCHGLGTRAPDLLTDHGGTGTIGQRCGSRVAGEYCKTYLYRAMVEPAAYLVEGFGPIMPDQRRVLSGNQIWALVAYLESLGGTVTVTGADLAAGSTETGPDGGAPAVAAAPEGPTSTATDPVQLMRDNLCLSCHLFGGEGVQLGPPLDGIGSRVSADYIRRSILEPAVEASEGYEAFTALMPATFGASLTAGQLEAIVRFLVEQR